MFNEVSYIPESIAVAGSAESYLVQPRFSGVYTFDKSLQELQATFASKYKTILAGEGEQQTLTVVQSVREDRSLIGESDQAKVEIRTTYRADGAMKEVRTHRAKSKIPDTLISFEYGIDSHDPSKKRLDSSTSSFVGENGVKYLSMKAIYERDNNGNVTNTKYERGDAASIPFAIEPDPTKNIDQLRASVAENLQMAKLLPNVINTVDSAGRIVLTVFTLAPGTFATLPVNIGVYQYTIETGLLRQTGRLSIILRASALQEVDQEVVADEAFITKHEYGFVSRTTLRRGIDIPYKTEVRPIDPQAQARFIE